MDKPPLVLGYQLMQASAQKVKDSKKTPAFKHA